MCYKHCMLTLGAKVARSATASEALAFNCSMYMTVRDENCSFFVYRTGKKTGISHADIPVL